MKYSLLVVSLHSVDSPDSLGDRLDWLPKSGRLDSQPHFTLACNL